MIFKKAFLGVILVSALSAKPFLIGGFQPESCSKSQDGLGKPINAFNHVMSAIDGLFSDGAKNLSLIHFSSQLVAGTLYNVLFSYKGSDRTRYIAIKVFVALPVYNEAPTIEKMLVGDSLEEAASSLGLSNFQPQTHEDCKADFVKDFKSFSVQGEVNNVANKFKEVVEKSEKSENAKSPDSAQVSVESVVPLIQISNSTINIIVESSIKPSEESKPIKGAGENLTELLKRIRESVETKITPVDLLTPQTTMIEGNFLGEREPKKVAPPVETQILPPIFGSSVPDDIVLLPSKRKSSPQKPFNLDEFNSINNLSNQVTFPTQQAFSFPQPYASADAFNPFAQPGFIESFTAQNNFVSGPRAHTSDNLASSKRIEDIINEGRKAISRRVRATGRNMMN